MRHNLKTPFKFADLLEHDKQTNFHHLRCPICFTLFLDSSKPGDPCHCPRCTVELTLPAWQDILLSRRRTTSVEKIRM